MMDLPTCRLGIATYIIICMLMKYTEAQCQLCAGGLSLLGFETLDESVTAADFRCCDDQNQMHGYNQTLLAEVLQDSLSDLMNTTIPIQKYQHSENLSQKKELFEPRDATVSSRYSIEDLLNLKARDEISCCDSQESVIYPVSAISATTHERVAVLQIEPFKQPVVYSICPASECRVLRGNCTQVYLPQQLYILKSNKDQLSPDRDFVLVESGCRCQPAFWQLESATIAPTSTNGVDESVKASLEMATGIVLENDDLASLAFIGTQVNPSTPSTPKPEEMSEAGLTWTASSSGHFSTPPTLLNTESNSSIDLGHGISNGSHSAFDGDWLTSSTTQSSHVTDNQPNQTSIVTHIQEPSTTTEPVTAPAPLLENLPQQAGSPVYIPEGYFNPVLQVIRPFLP